MSDLENIFDPESGMMKRPHEVRACPVCRPGLILDGARPERCIAHGGQEDGPRPVTGNETFGTIHER